MADIGFGYTASITQGVQRDDRGELHGGFHGLVQHYFEEAHCAADNAAAANAADNAAAATSTRA